MKVKLNPMFEQASGQLGGIVFREVRGRTFAGRKPSGSGEPTVDQAAQRERFKQAAAYGNFLYLTPKTSEGQPVSVPGSPYATMGPAAPRAPKQPQQFTPGIAPSSHGYGDTVL